MLELNKEECAVRGIPTELRINYNISQLFTRRTVYSKTLDLQCHLRVYYFKAHFIKYLYFFDGLKILHINIYLYNRKIYQYRLIKYVSTTLLCNCFSFYIQVP